MSPLDPKRFLSTGIAVVLSALPACTGTHTGNPAQPDGADFVRSDLTRELEPDVSAAQRAQLAEDNQDFAFDLYAELAAQDDGANVFMSPYSVSVGLGMLYAGTSGETQSETHAAARWNLPEPELHAAFNATTLELESRSAREKVSDGKETDGARVSIDNALFTRKGTKLHPEYLDVLATNYDAGVYRIDFDDADNARKAINDWVAERTQQRIEGLLPADAIKPNTVFVLTDAVYFNAHWYETFQVEGTLDGTFHAAAGDVPVRMMRKPHGHLNYVAGADYQAVALPFAPTTMSMMIILPSEGQFAAVEQRLDRTLLADIRQAMTIELVDLSMPRFRIESEFELSAHLAALGMQRAFGADADFSRMTDSGLQISSVRHKTFFAVDEEGAEAAAATGFLGSLGSDPRDRAVVTLDRPFLFLIYDEPTNHVLFVGRLENPR